MTTAPLRDAYQRELAAAFQDLGMAVERKSWFWQDLPAIEGRAAAVVGFSATYGRLITQVNMEVEVDGFEALVRRVLGADLCGGLPGWTLFLPVKSLNGPPRPKDVRWRALWPPEQALLEVFEPSDIEPAVRIITSVWTELVRPYLASLASLWRVAEEHRFMAPEKQPMALHLLGDDEGAHSLIDELSVDRNAPPPALLTAYRTRLQEVAPLRP